MPAKTEKPQHTPGKWTVRGNTIWSSACKDRGSVCEFRLATGTHIPDNQNEVNAEFVARAVNHHQELVEALRYAHVAIVASNSINRDKWATNTRVTEQKILAVLAQVQPQK